LTASLIFFQADFIVSTAFIWGTERYFSGIRVALCAPAEFLNTGTIFAFPTLTAVNWDHLTGLGIAGIAFIVY
jgi:hypothetical protein